MERHGYVFNGPCKIQTPIIFMNSLRFIEWFRLDWDGDHANWQLNAGISHSSIAAMKWRWRLKRKRHLEHIQSHRLRGLLSQQQPNHMQKENHQVANLVHSTYKHERWIVSFYLVLANQSMGRDNSVLICSQRAFFDSIRCTISEPNVESEPHAPQTKGKLTHGGSSEPGKITFIIIVIDSIILLKIEERSISYSPLLFERM